MFRFKVPPHVDTLERLRKVLGPPAVAVKFEGADSTKVRIEGKEKLRLQVEAFARRRTA